MGVMSQKILMVSLEGLQTLGAANYFGIRIHEEMQEVESPLSNLPGSILRKAHTHTHITLTHCHTHMNIHTQSQSCKVASLNFRKRRVLADDG